MSFILAFFILGVIAFGIYGAIHSSHDHWSPASGAALREDASVTDINTTRYNKYKFKTTVTFSDGFQYIAFDTNNVPSGLNSRMISVTPQMKAAIAQRAMNKHNSLIKNQQK